MNTSISDSLVETKILDQLRVLSSQIGETPLFPLNNIFSKPGVKVFAKIESQQLGGSVKARAAFNIITEAILSNSLRKNMRLLDASSGNTAIAYATFANALGFGITICIPETSPVSRIATLKALGAEVVFSSKYEGIEGARSLAQELYAQAKERYFFADQFYNDHNWSPKR